VDIAKTTLQILDEALNLHGRSATFTRETPLLGALPELDSMAVLAVLTAVEERFGLTIDDDDIDGSVFTTVGTLVAFIETRLAGH